jgi:hypothetical protein
LLGSFGPHNAGVAGSSPAPATYMTATWATRLKWFLTSRRRPPEHPTKRPSDNAERQGIVLSYHLIDEAAGLGTFSSVGQAAPERLPAWTVRGLTRGKPPPHGPCLAGGSGLDDRRSGACQPRSLLTRRLPRSISVSPSLDQGTPAKAGAAKPRVLAPSATPRRTDSPARRHAGPPRTAGTRGSTAAFASSGWTPSPAQPHPLEESCGVLSLFSRRPPSPASS